jgi:hypothetical protein
MRPTSNGKCGDRSITNRSASNLERDSRRYHVAGMKLYHYTIPENALLIGLGNGLKASLGKPSAPTEREWQTMGVPVVWLTKGDNRAMAADVEWCKVNAENPADAKIGFPMFGGPIRCVVEIERSRYVIRYEEFMRTLDRAAIDPATGELNYTGADVLRGLAENGPPSYKGMILQWWICTRDIPASKIAILLTRAQAIEGCEHHMTTHKDPEARERWTQQRETFAEAPEDAIFSLENGTCRMLRIRDPKAA